MVLQTESINYLKTASSPSMYIVNELVDRVEDLTREMEEENVRSDQCKNAFDTFVYNVLDISSSYDSKSVSSSDDSDIESLDISETEEVELELDDVYNIHLFESYNNTIATISSSSFKTIYTISSGRLGYKKSRRKHFNAYHAIWYDIVSFLTKRKAQAVHIRFNLSTYRSLRSLVPNAFYQSTIAVLSVRSYLAQPYNGCKLPRPNR